MDVGGGNAKDIITLLKNTNGSKNTKIMKSSWSKFPNIFDFINFSVIINVDGGITALIKILEKEIHHCLTIILPKRVHANGAGTI